MTCEWGRDGDRGGIFVENRNTSPNKRTLGAACARAQSVLGYIIKHALAKSRWGVKTVKS